MSGISALHILNNSGQTLLSKHFKLDNIPDPKSIFTEKVLQEDEPTFMYIYLTQTNRSRQGR